MSERFEWGANADSVSDLAVRLEQAESEDDRAAVWQEYAAGGDGSAFEAESATVHAHFEGGRRLLPLVLHANVHARTIATERAKAAADEWSG